MKKVFFLIVLVIMAFTIATQTFAQADERRRLEQSQQQGQQRVAQLQQELGQLQTDFQAGNITMDQFQRRVTEIQTELQNLNNQVSTAQQQYNQSGATFTQAQIQRIETLLDQDKNLQAQYHTGQINEANYNRQINSVRNELNQITTPFQDSPAAMAQYQEIEKRIERIWPGVHSGWPTTEEWNTIMRVCGVGPFTQSRGTKASHTIEGGRFWYIVQTGGNIDTVFQEMKNQLERAVRGKVIAIIANDNNTYNVELLEPGAKPSANTGHYSTFEISVRKRNDSVVNNGVIISAGFFENFTATRPFPTPIQ